MCESYKCSICRTVTCCVVAAVLEVVPVLVTPAVVENGLLLSKTAAVLLLLTVALVTVLVVVVFCGEYDGKSLGNSDDTFFMNVAGISLQFFSFGKCSSSSFQLRNFSLMKYHPINPKVQQ